LEKGQVRFVPLKVKRRGVEMRLIINGGNEPRKPDPALLKAFARARGWLEELASGRVRSLVEIARRERLAKRYVARLTKLAFVSPAVVDAIAEGHVPPGINLQMLMDGRIDVPPQMERSGAAFYRLVVAQNRFVINESPATWSNSAASACPARGVHSSRRLKTDPPQREVLPSGGSNAGGGGSGGSTSCLRLALG
jgi:hypothetical protein